MKKYGMLVAVVFFALMVAGTAMAGSEPYELKDGSTYVSLVDHYMRVTLQVPDDLIGRVKSDPVVAIKMMKGTTFEVQEMYRISKKFATPISKAEYESCPDKYEAMGRDAATIIVRNVNEEMQAYVKGQQDVQKNRVDYKNRHPSIGEVLADAADRTAKIEGSEFIRRMGRDLFEDMWRKNSPLRW